MRTECHECGEAYDLRGLVVNYDRLMIIRGRDTFIVKKVKETQLKAQNNNS